MKATCLLPLALTLLLAACAPGIRDSRTLLGHFDYMDANYYGLRITLASPENARLQFFQPGAFPDPELRYVVDFACGIGLAKANQRVDSGYSTDLVAAKEYLGTLPDASYGKDLFRIKDFRVSCNEGFVKVQGPDFDRVVRTLAPTVTGLASDDGALEFFIGNGYRYPNLKIDYFETLLFANIQNGTVTASRNGFGPSVVALTQNGTTDPVLFDGEQTTAAFDPSSPATLAVQRDSNRTKRFGWDVVEFNYQDAFLFWRQSDVRPY